MKARLIELVESKHVRSDIPDFRPGDTIRVMVKITERSRNEERTRVQAFEGDVIRRSGGGINEIVTVRRVTYGIGVERTFPIHAPIVDSIELVRMGQVRRAKLYYLRDRSGRAGRIPEAKEGRRKARLAAEDTADAEAEAVVEPEVETEETEVVEESAGDVESSEQVVTEQAEEQAEEASAVEEQAPEDTVTEALAADDTPDETEAAEEEAETTEDE